MAVSIITLKTGDRIITELKEIFDGEADNKKGVCLLMEDPYILNLDSAVFSGSLQLVNRETGEVIHQSQVTESDENAPVQLAFTSSSDLEYLVRVISLEETAMGSYTLGATSGQLTPGVSDQTIQGSITEDDEVYRFWGGRYSDRYDITNLSDFQTINIELTRVLACGHC